MIVAGEMIRASSVYKALRVIARQAKKADELAETWKKEYGADDDMRRYELVRAETYRKAVVDLLELLDLDAKQLWPDLIVDD